MRKKSITCSSTRVAPPLASLTVVAKAANPGTKVSSLMRNRGPLGTSRTAVASITRTPGCPWATRQYQTRSPPVGRTKGENSALLATAPPVGWLEIEAHPEGAFNVQRCARRQIESRRQLKEDLQDVGFGWHEV